MADAKFPLAKMPAFTTEQMAWLRGHFYDELVDPTLSVQEMCHKMGVNSVIVKIEERQRLLRGVSPVTIDLKGG